MLYRFYALFSTACFLFLRPFAPLARFFCARSGYRLEERLGLYSGFREEQTPDEKRIWFHASSVGEVQVALRLVGELERRGRQGFFLTVMTEQGHRVAQHSLAGRVTCLLVPLDVPLVVRRALAFIRPKLFVCIETELWPALLHEVRAGGITMCLVNGRMSERSFRRYRKITGTMQRLLAGFSQLSVIRSEDGARFTALGVPKENIRVTGNSKYGQSLAEKERIRNQYRKRFGLEKTTVFLCGSTRTGEEEQLLPVYERLREVCNKRLIWIIAPRHLQRLPEIQEFFVRSAMAVDVLSRCSDGDCKADILLVDSMGELVNLYAAGDLNFCGGSLVNRGGHNIMESVRWGMPIYFGPFMTDFQDAVDLVVPAGAGVQVADADELAEILCKRLQNTKVYNQDCRAAEGVARVQSDALKQQADMICQLLDNDELP